MTFRIEGLDPAPFRSLYGLPEAELAARNVRRCVVDRTPGFPDRVELRDLEAGETALLVNYLHQPAPTAFRASHAIYVREGAERAGSWRDEVPAVLRVRIISLRAFDDAGSMVDAVLADGRAIEPAIVRVFNNPAVAYIHAHYAAPGCYAALIARD